MEALRNDFLAQPQKRKPPCCYRVALAVFHDTDPIGLQNPAVFLSRKITTGGSDGGSDPMCLHFSEEYLPANRLVFSFCPPL
jgi:hypothetical protein